MSGQGLGPLLHGWVVRIHQIEAVTFIVSLSDSLVGILLAIPNVRLRVALSMQGISHESPGSSFSESEEVATCFD